MKVIAGRVVNGRIETDESVLPEGAAVEVTLLDEGEEWDATPEEEADLLAAIEDGDREGFVEALPFLSALRAKRFTK